jgi:parallel beta-helix repeat protein
MSKKLLFSVACLMAVGVLAPNIASAAQPACGEVITQSVTLSAPVTGCPWGLVVGADSITIDLNGYTIEGAGAIGIDVAGRSGVTIRNGIVRGFDVGVRLADAPGSSVRGLLIRDVGNGIELMGSGPSSVSGNAVSDASRVGILCHDGGENLISNNVVTRSGTGIVLFFCTADVLGNMTYGNTGDGIFRGRSAGRIERNVSSQNGRHGINSDDSHGNFIRNVTMRNRVNGLVITDSIPDHGPFHTITGHVAIGNGEYGIYTTLAGVVDGGWNVARANGNSAQCFGFTCS